MKDLAADCPYPLNCYHTQGFHRGAKLLFPVESGTNGLAGFSGNLTMSQGTWQRSYHAKPSLGGSLSSHLFCTSLYMLKFSG
jgi:hypothetical protein